MEIPHASSTAESQFLPPIIISPTAADATFTIIFLHGRGQTAEYFHEPLLSTPLPMSSNRSVQLTFQEALPHAKFVFPTAPITRATKYKRSLIHQWYDGSGDWEPEALGGMRDSVQYVHSLVRREIQLLGGDASRVVLAGFSQGCAMAVTSFLLWEGDPLGALIGMAGFTPLNGYMMDLLGATDVDDDQSDGGIIFGSDSSDDNEDFSGFMADVKEHRSPLQNAVRALREEAELPDTGGWVSPLSFLESPVYLGHGTGDPEVEYKHGKLNAALLQKMGIIVDFHTYEGLEHCYSSQMLADIVSFLKSKITNLSG